MSVTNIAVQEEAFPLIQSTNTTSPEGKMVYTPTRMLIQNQMHRSKFCYSHFAFLAAYWWEFWRNKIPSFRFFMILCLLFELPMMLHL